MSRTVSRDSFERVRAEAELHRQRAKDLTKALVFYADPATYEDGAAHGSAHPGSAVAYDQGKVARKALAKAVLDSRPRRGE